MKRFTNSRFLFAAFLAAFLGACVFYAYREIWVFISPYLSFMGGAMGLFCVFMAAAAALLVLFVLRLYGEKRGCEAPVYKTRRFGAAAVIATVIGALGVLAAVGFIAVNDWQTNRVMVMYLKRMAPWMALAVGAVLGLVVLPVLKGKKKVFLAAALAVCVLLTVLLQVFPVAFYRITSDPLVLDTGADYSVVFATSAEGTGFVEYEYKGENYTVYAQNDGRIVGDRLIHSVHVPYEHLRNNDYSVGSTRVIEQYSYGSRPGKTVKSGDYHFTVPTGDETSYLVVSDWHSYTDRALDASTYFGDYDAVLLMGDAAAGMDFEEEAAEFIVKFGGDLTRGAIPAVFVRGNHDTRGAFAADLPGYLGLTSLYYTVSINGVSFVVLDSGEDKEDSHIEYGGMDDYARQRRAELEWLQNLAVEDDRVIVLTHAWQVSEPEPEVSAAAWNEFDRLGVRFLLCGHQHKCRLLGNTEEEKAMLEAHPGITAYISGYGKQRVVSMLTVRRGDVQILATGGDPFQIDLTEQW